MLALPPFITSFVRRYLGATIAYGLVRGAVNAQDRAQDHHIHGTTLRERKPLLLSEKVGYAVHSALLAPWVWPLMLHEDAVYLELHLHGEAPESHGRSCFPER